ncbi:MAG: hypothetical protein K8R67_07585 [Desulfobacteraceae bacterium]|nr:hypothetical protein [Desulfobacteraceae bacterium]
MKKQIKKKIIIFFVVMCLLIPSAVRFTHADGGQDLKMSYVDSRAVLATVVFVLWTSVFIIALLHHSNLKSKRFSNSGSKKLFLIPPIGLLGLNLYNRLAFLSNPAAVFALAFSKQRPAVTKLWNGDVTINPVVINGQSNGLVSSVDKGDESCFPVYVKLKLQF